MEFIDKKLVFHCQFKIKPYICSQNQTYHNMTYRNIIVILALVLLFSCSGHNDKLYVELETCLAKRQEVTKAKEDKIAELKAELNKCNDENERFALCDSLVKHYYLFNSDSASKYIDLAMKNAVSLNRADYINKVRIFDEIGRAHV